MYPQLWSWLRRHHSASLQVVDAERMKMRELLEVMAGADVVFSVYGAQLTWSQLAPPHCVIVEINYNGKRHHHVVGVNRASELEYGGYAHNADQHHVSISAPFDCLRASAQSKKFFPGHESNLDLPLVFLQRALDRAFCIVRSRSLPKGPAPVQTRCDFDHSLFRGIYRHYVFSNSSVLNMSCRAYYLEEAAHDGDLAARAQRTRFLQWMMANSLSLLASLRSCRFRRSFRLTIVLTSTDHEIFGVLSLIHVVAGFCAVIPQFVVLHHATNATLGRELSVFDKSPYNAVHFFIKENHHMQGSWNFVLKKYYPVHLLFVTTEYGFVHHTVYRPGRRPTFIYNVTP
jgi:hypothetical protein